MTRIATSIRAALAGLLLLFPGATATLAQTPPSASEISAYEGLFKAAHDGDLETLQRLSNDNDNLDIRDGRGRTPLHVAAHASHEDAIEILVKAGANPNAFDKQAYDIVTIAAVAADLEVLKTALKVGASSDNITSPYEGTALIAAAHLGHHEVVKILIDAGAPLDHINNLHWTALMEAVVLGDGGPDHLTAARHLIEAGADKTIGDRDGVTPLEHARRRGYTEMVALF
ncbi:MAG: ankyrin repeat domain-containing protein [Pseudomonadota bacterium]